MEIEGKIIILTAKLTALPATCESQFLQIRWLKYLTLKPNLFDINHKHNVLCIFIKEDKKDNIMCNGPCCLRSVPGGLWYDFYMILKAT